MPIGSCRHSRHPRTCHNILCGCIVSRLRFLQLGRCTSRVAALTIWACKLAILRACYKARKPPKPENTKKIQNPPLRVGPRKYRKNTEKIRKRSENGNFWAVFSFFRYFFRISGSTWSGGFCVWGFSGSVAGPQDRKCKPEKEFHVGALINQQR